MILSTNILTLFTSFTFRSLPAKMREFGRRNPDELPNGHSGILRIARAQCNSACHCGFDGGKKEMSSHLNSRREGHWHRIHACRTRQLLNENIMKTNTGNKTSGKPSSGKPRIGNTFGISRTEETKKKAPRTKVIAKRAPRNTLRTPALLLTGQ